MAAQVTLLVEYIAPDARVLSFHFAEDIGQCGSTGEGISQAREEPFQGICEFHSGHWPVFIVAGGLVPDVGGVGIGPPFCDDLFHIVGQFAFEEHVLAACRMDEADGLCVQGVPGANGEAVVDELPVFTEDGAFYDLIPAIGVVVEQGMADMLHMHPDLMSAACFQHTLYQGDIPETFQDLIMGDGFLAVVAFRIGIE